MSKTKSQLRKMVRSLRQQRAYLARRARQAEDSRDYAFASWSDCQFEIIELARPLLFRLDLMRVAARSAEKQL